MCGAEVMQFHSPLCVALDFPDAPSVRRIAAATAPYAGVLRIGLTTVYGTGARMVGELSAQRPVFLDAKLHDIPAQVEGAVTAIAAMGPRFVTVHAAGGYDMVKAASSAAGASLTVLAVTVLTSLDDAELEHLGFAGPTEDTVLRLGERALEAGAGGLVCSPLEVAALRSRFGPRGRGGPLLVVPGIRPRTWSSDDQKRTLDARATLDAGADLLVIGRPITASPDPATAAADLLEELS